jgi:hypothetical protein
VEFICAPGPLRNGAQAMRAHRPAIEAAVHTALLNRGFLIAPFHNMMLVSPATKKRQIDRLIAAFDEVLTDLLGVPINHTELQAAELERLNQPASTLELSNVSVEQLLETILTPLDLTYRLEPTQLLLIPRTAPSSADR